VRQPLHLPTVPFSGRKRFILPLLIAVLAVQLLGAASSPLRIAAQSEMNEPMIGRALFPGAIVGDVRYGVTFSGMANGELPGWWTVTVNYSPPSADGGMINTIQGGRWQVTQLENGIYRGSIFGEVVNGTIVRDPTGVYADVSVEFKVVGGTGAYAGATGTGRLVDGKADHTPFPPTLDGRITLNLDRH
jgi:hypothetical protein